jgi:hypothetical protein
MVLGRLRAVAPVLADPDRTVPWHTIDYQRLIWLRDHLQSTGVSPRAINLTLIFVRGIASAAADLGLIAEGTADAFKVGAQRPGPCKAYGARPSVHSWRSGCTLRRLLAGPLDRRDA